jgi:hypothetical protein
MTKIVIAPTANAAFQMSCHFSDVGNMKPGILRHFCFSEAFLFNEQKTTPLIAIEGVHSFEQTLTLDQPRLVVRIDV